MRIKTPSLFKIFLSSGLPINVPVKRSSNHFLIKIVIFSCKNNKKVQGKGFEPSDSCETGCLIGEPFVSSILSPAPLAKLGYPCRNIEITREVRTPGFEPGQEAWRASIITTRSHPHARDSGLSTLMRSLVDINSSFIIFFIKQVPFSSFDSVRQ